jgi:hypothetical protein
VGLLTAAYWRGNMGQAVYQTRVLTAVRLASRPCRLNRDAGGPRSRLAPRVNPSRPSDPLPASTAARGSVAAFQARAGHTPTAWSGYNDTMTMSRMRPVGTPIRRP